MVCGSEAGGQDGFVLPVRARSGWVWVAKLYAACGFIKALDAVVGELDQHLVSAARCDLGHGRSVEYHRIRQPALFAVEVAHRLLMSWGVRPGFEFFFGGRGWPRHVPRLCLPDAAMPVKPRVDSCLSVARPTMFAVPAHER